MWSTTEHKYIHNIIRSLRQVDNIVSKLCNNILYIIYTYVFSSKARIYNLKEKYYNVSALITKFS